MFVRPLKGLQVPDPQVGDFLPETGRKVERNQYWLRRVIDQDVSEVTPKATKKEA